MVLCDHCKGIRFPLLKEDDRNAAAATAPSEEESKGAKDSDAKKPLVTNELLTFVTQKLNTMPPDTIIQLCCSFYDDYTVEEASRILHTMCADGNDPAERYRKRIGDNKKKSTMQDIISLCQKRCGSDGFMCNVVFCAVNINSLPPVSFNNLDVSSLLAKIESNKTEMDLMKVAVNKMMMTVTEQSAMCNNMHDAVIDICKTRESAQGAAAFELMTTTGEALHMNVKVADALPDMAVKAPTEPPKQHAPRKADVPLPAAGSSMRENQVTPVTTKTSNERADANVRPENEVECDITDEEMATYSQTMKNGIMQMKHARSTMLPPKPRKESKDAPQKTKKQSAITGKGTNIGFAAKKKVRFANVFASRLEPGVTEAQVKDHLDSTLSLNCKVECVKSTDWYTSFHITCACPNPMVFMDEAIWPDGTYVRWWGEKRGQSQTDEQKNDGNTIPKSVV